ncbi:ATP-dependent DNA helicase DinG [Aeromicrobium ponti]|uniref:3'-5' exonuclease DinG n=1 Tax=Cytobacillus oceanisediminis TaxID=665099 RepID=A0A562K199_9BACI|nr:ATP-dependent DNA helicase DinG [Cytobacillus oceanisediminis]TWH89146.1 ATP-dependent DNA helicase DinG [Cytobacillus oceanisediminis]
MGNKYVVVDLETTGNAPKKGDKIIQFAAVVIENGKITEEYSSYVNPEQPIPPFIEELTGLSDHMVEDAPLFSEIAPKVLTILEGAFFVAHNVLFDLSFLQEELLEAGYNGFYGPVLDTVEMSRMLFPTADSFKLSDLAHREGLNHERPHQADSDAYVTAELLLILLKKLEYLPLKTLEQLHKLSGGLKSDLDILLDELILIKESKIENLPDFIEIHRGIALKKGSMLQYPDSLTGTGYPFGIEEKQEMFMKAFPSYEIRQGQFKMMDSVYGAFNDKKHALIEAGTGVGKSLAYLVPSAVYGKENGKTVIISTYTTQLQEQLLTKDIPLLHKMLPFPVKAVLLKGRSHYISLAKFVQTLRDEEEDNYDTILSKMQILVWLMETDTGDIDELNLSSGGMIFWSKIKNDETAFLQDKSWISRDFYLRARKEAQSADIIITNHSLLLTDLVAKSAILPKFSHVIIDEGHHFVKASGKHFGHKLDYLTVRLLLGQIGLFEQKQLFYKLEKLVEEKAGNPEDMIHSFEINQLIVDLLHEMDELFKVIGIYAKKYSKAKKSSPRLTVRFINGSSDKESKAVIACAERFGFLLRDLMEAIEKRVMFVAQIKGSLTLEEKALMEEVASIFEDLKDLNENVKHIFQMPLSQFVVWIEMDTRSAQNATTVYAQPVTVSNYLKEQFFSEKESAVITSATLSVKDSFHFILNELGLEEQECTLEQIPSPFNYQEQVKLLIPGDLPEVNAVPLEEYVASISEHIISIAEATKGRMLILFTSHEMLRKTYELIKESGFLEDYAVIAQGITSGSRSRLTRNFQRFDKAILLGTSSFWEGVDIPGEDLSCLVIVRLPFSPPDEPMAQAKNEQIKSEGGNPFSSYSLPEAVIRFKQGVGRLIRTSSDRGFIVVFDRRIVTTKYGKAFLDSIPPIPVQKSNIDEIVELIYTWL